MAKKAYIGDSNGKARQIKKGYVGVNGVARELDKGYIGVNGVARQFWQRATPIGELAVGDTVYMNVDGVSTEFIIVQQGLPSDAYDSSCDGTWLLMKDVYSNVEWGFYDAYNDYSFSNVHCNLSELLVNRFDSDVQSLIKLVRLPYTNGTGSEGIIATGSDGISEKVFLLSYTEVGFSGSLYANVEGAVLDYFNGAANAKRIAHLNGALNTWWLRSPYKEINEYDMDVWYVTASGRANHTDAMGLDGYRPALILPFETLVDGEFAVIAD